MKIVQKSSISAQTYVKNVDIPLDSERARAVGFAAEEGGLRVVCCPASAGWELPAGETPAAAFRLQTAGGEARLLYCVSGKTYYRLPSGGAFAQGSVQFSRVPACVEITAEENALLFSDGESVALLTKDGFAAREDIPAFVCGAWYYERLWLALPGEGGKIKFSAPADYSDFNEAIGGGGEIEFPDAAGEVRALIPLGIYMYVVRARGVQRLEARGSERDFILRDLFSCGDILAGSAAAVAGKLFWAERGGVFSYGGSGEAEEVCPAFCENLPLAAEKVRGGAFGRRYALQIGEMLAFFRAEGGSACVAARGVGGLTCPAGGALCVYRGEVCEVSAGNPSLCVWESEPCSAGGRALLRAVRVRASGAFTLTIESGGGKRRIEIAGRGGERRYSVNLAGENFVFRLRAEGEGEVRSLAAEYEKLRGGMV